MPSNSARLRTMLCSASLTLMFALTSCGGPSPTAKPDLCAGWAPIRPEAHDVEVMSGVLADQILQHDTHGAEACGWTR